MTQQRDWVPHGIDTTTPSGARVYDYLLGGSHNFAADRAFAEKAVEIMPSVQDVARLNRAFLGRVVRFMMSDGIRQFLDIGSGIPTVGNVHQIAEETDPECRVVYVDRDPIAVAHSEMLLAGNDRTAAVHADFRDVDGIFTSPAVKRLLNFDEPIGLLMVALLHWIPDEWGVPALLGEYRRRVPPGSYLAISHLTREQQSEEMGSAVTAFNRAKGRDQATIRSYTEIAAMFGDFEMIEPGLVACALWHSDGAGSMSDQPEANAQIYVGVGKKST